MKGYRRILPAMVFMIGILFLVSPVFAQDRGHGHDVVSLPLAQVSLPIGGVSEASASASPQPSFTPQPSPTIAPTPVATPVPATPTPITPPTSFAPLIIATPTPVPTPQPMPTTAPVVSNISPKPSASPKPVTAKTVQAPLAQLVTTVSQGLYPKSGFAPIVSTLLYFISIACFLSGVLLLRPHLLAQVGERLRHRRAHLVQQMS